MSQDLGVEYPEPGKAASEQFDRLYQIADNKLVAFLGFMERKVAVWSSWFILAVLGEGGPIKRFSPRPTAFNLPLVTVALKFRFAPARTRKES